MFNILNKEVSIYNYMKSFSHDENIPLEGNCVSDFLFRL